MRSRGAALPETAIILGVCLTLLFGTVEVGLIGLAQLSSDGGAFVAAHTAVFGGDPNAAVSQTFPNLVGQSTVTTAANPPDLTADPVWGSPANNDALTNPTDRHGGIQIVRPTHMQATVNAPNQGLDFGDFLSFANAQVGSAAIEGRMMVSDPGFDLQSSTLNSSQSLDSQISYFSDDGNAPPYFIGFKEGSVCTSVAAGGGCTGTAFVAFSAAEYLDGNNWAAAQNGVGQNGVYYAMLLHQHVYANIANELDGIQSQLQASGGVSSTKTFLDPASDPCVEAVYAWNVAIPHSSGFDWRQYPLTPLGGDGGPCS